MNFFLTGASGLVGGAFTQNAARKKHRIIGTVSSFSGLVEGLAERVVLNVGNSDALAAQVEAANPDVIINAAGISEPAKCEADPARSNLLNITLPAQLAEIALQLGVRFIHLSSEQVFDGTRAPYTMTDPVSPINLYGRQKVESEQRVHALAPQHAATIRLPLLMGNSPGGQRSLHERLFADWSAGKTPRVYIDEFRQTCTAENVGEVLLELSQRRDLRGVFQWAGRDRLSRVEHTQRIREHFKLSAERAPFIPIQRSDDPAGALKRQADLALDLRPLVEQLKTPSETFAEQLDRLLVPPPFRAWYQTSVTSN